MHINDVQLRNDESAGFFHWSETVSRFEEISQPRSTSKLLNSDRNVGYDEPHAQCVAEFESSCQFLHSTARQRQTCMVHLM